MAELIKIHTTYKGHSKSSTPILHNCVSMKVNHMKCVTFVAKSLSCTFIDNGQEKILKK